MNKSSLGLILATWAVCTSCQNPGKGNEGASETSEMKPTMFDVRDITRTSYHHGACQCTSAIDSKENIWDCSVGDEPEGCGCTIYTEIELEASLRQKIFGVEDIQAASVEIENGILIIQAGSEAIGEAIRVLDSIREKCE